MAFDPETVVFLPTYRVGVLAPEAGSLPPGELCIEMGDGSAPPKFWVGGFDGQVVAVGGAASADMSAMQAQIADLEARVAALETPVGTASAAAAAAEHTRHSRDRK
jgi:outer membrane murein-binding lipoprotein Lpp